MRIDGITIFRLANDRLVEGWTNEDLLGMLRKPGAVRNPVRRDAKYILFLV
jgi:hypothetical protein